MKLTNEQIDKILAGAEDCDSVDIHPETGEVGDYWHGGVFTRSIPDLREILELRREVGRLKSKLRAAKNYLEIDSLIDDIEALCGEDSEELVEVTHLWNQAHEDLSAAKHYAKKVLPKPPKEQDHE